MAEKSFLRLFGEYYGMVLDIVVPPLLGAVLGYFLDAHYGTGPWAMVSGVGVGFIAGVMSTIRLAKKLDREGRGIGENKED